MTPAIILVRPQLGENIGAAARAMANFGLSDLRLVAPRDGWPNPKAREMAAHATDIIDRAQVFASLAEAISDRQWLYATTARPRDMLKTVVTPREAAGQLRAHMADGLAAALLFGPERTGLTNDEIALCDTAIAIPTAPENTSLNVAQALVVVAYEWFVAEAEAPACAAPMDEPTASKEEILGFLDHLERALDAAHYFRTEEIRPVMWRNLQNMFTRARLTPQEVRTLRGVLRALGRMNA